MSDFVQVNAGGLTAVYDPQQNVKVNVAGVTVVYSLEPDIGLVKVGAAGLTVVFDIAPPAKRLFPLPKSKTRWQNIPGVRKFPTIP